MEPLGKKLQDARLAKKITLEEASRVTKIRAARIKEIEAEDFSSFSQPRLREGISAHLRQISRRRCVAVSRCIRDLERGERRRLFLFAGRAGHRAAPDRAPADANKRPALLPFIIAVAVLVLGLYLVKLLARYPAHHADGSAARCGRFGDAVTNRHATRRDRRAPRRAGGEYHRPAKHGVTVAPIATPQPVSLRQPAPNRRCAGPSRSSRGRRLRLTLPHSAAGQSRADQAGAENFSARDSRWSGAARIRRLGGSGRSAAFVSRLARDDQSAGARRGANYQKWSGARGGRRRT